MTATAGSPPTLPAALTKALGVWESGAVVKILVRYARPFWRERGLSGMAMWRDMPGLFACDASKNAEHAALVVFVGGPLALRWRELGEAALRVEVTTRLTDALGPEAADVLDFNQRDWTHDRWSGGAYSDLIVDVMARHAERIILAGASPVHFAASELSPSFPGYVEGAIVAGRSAARKLDRALTGQWGVALAGEADAGHRQRFEPSRLTRPNLADQSCVRSLTVLWALQEHVYRKPVAIDARWRQTGQRRGDPNACFNPVTRAIAIDHSVVTWRAYVRFMAEGKITKGTTDVCESPDRRLQSPCTRPGAQ